MTRHIVIVAPPWYPVPPHGYGGIELVVSLLAGELRRRDHRVVVIAAEGSENAVIRAPTQWGEDLGRPDERIRDATYALRVCQVINGLGTVDVIHDHAGFATLIAAAAADRAPVVHTVHGSLREPERSFYTEVGRSADLVAISESQRRSAPELGWRGAVHNAVDTGALQIASAGDKEPYLLCLARICPDKGQHTAIEVARHVGMRLVLAGKIEPTPQGRDYHERSVAPAVDGDRVIHLHNVAGPEKARLIARARALLAPIQWEEPFGLAIVEAMASGTAAIAFRRGAAAELIVDGYSGFVVGSVDEMVAAVRAAREIDPQACAQLARRRFGPAAMADGYLGVYQRAVEHAQPAVA